jgi:5'-methylthioadenosine phosphorylase
MDSAEIAIIGGTASIDPGILRDVRDADVSTPYGKPSGRITLGTLEGVRVAILPRHGKGHTIPPHLINHRANIDALHRLGVKRIIATAAAGSLQEDYRAGDVVIPDQFIDWSREVHTVFGEGRFYHVSMADPFCPELSRVLAEVSRKLNLRVHDRGAYLRIDGPQFSTRAASRMYRKFADIIGMTSVPEAILARERQMCLAVLATVTDYDCWKDTVVDYGTVKKVISHNIENTKRILLEAVKSIPGERSCPCSRALEGAEA